LKKHTQKKKIKKKIEKQKIVFFVYLVFGIVDFAAYFIGKKFIVSLLLEKSMFFVLFYDIKREEVDQTGAYIKGRREIFFPFSKFDLSASNRTKYTLKQQTS